jgi:hypothetical protein
MASKQESLQQRTHDVREHAGGGVQPMTRLLIGGATVVVAVIVAFVLIDQNGSDQDASMTPDSSRSSTNRSSTEDQRTADQPGDGVSRPSLSGQRPTLAPRVQRPNENPDNFEARLMTLQLYDRFLQRANLSDEQQRRLESTLADAQVEFSWLQRSLDEAANPRDLQTAANVRRYIESGNMAQAFNQEIAVRLAEFMSEEQIALFRNLVGGAYGFVASYPFDVPVAYDMGQGAQVLDAG